MRFGETFRWRALSSLETLAFSFMVERSTIIGKDLKETKKKSAGEDEVKTVFSAFTALSNLPLQKNRDPFLSLSERATKRERERSILFRPGYDCFTHSVLFVFSFKFQFSRFGFGFGFFFLNKFTRNSYLFNLILTWILISLRLHLLFD